MEDIKHVVANNIKKYRKEERLTLQQLSYLTCVSKTMLNQIETEKSSPSITILWRISSGLKIPLSKLISSPHKGVEVIDKSEIQAIYDNEKRSVSYPYFLYQTDQPFEVFQTELKPYSSLKPEAHHQESTIFLMVTKGVVNMIIENNKYSLSQDQAIKFNSHLHHEYLNASEKTISFISILHYKM